MSYAYTHDWRYRNHAPLDSSLSPKYQPNMLQQWFLGVVLQDYIIFLAGISAVDASLASYCQALVQYRTRYILSTWHTMIPIRKLQGTTRVWCPVYFLKSTVALFIISHDVMRIKTGWYRIVIYCCITHGLGIGPRILSRQVASSGADGVWAERGPESSSGVPQVGALCTISFNYVLSFALLDFYVCRLRRDWKTVTSGDLHPFLIRSWGTTCSKVFWSPRIQQRWLFQCNYRR